LEYKRELVSREKSKSFQSKVVVNGGGDGNGRGEKHGARDPTTTSKEGKEREPKDENRMCDVQNAPYKM